MTVRLSVPDIRVMALLVVFVLSTCTACAGGNGVSDTDSGSSVDGDMSDSESPADVNDAVEHDSVADTVDADAGPRTIQVEIMTFNVLCSFCDNTFDPWADRINYITDIIARHDPDILGSQELFMPEEVVAINDLNPQFEVLYYQGVEGVDIPNADAAVFFRKNRFEAVEHGTFWLSSTPDEPWSKSFSEEQALPRLVEWVRFREKSTGIEFLYANTHFDNNIPCQEMSAPLLLSRLGPRAADMPVLVTGDFNSKPDSPAYGILSNGVDGQGFKLLNAFDLASDYQVVHNQNPAPQYLPENRIDHIWVGGGDGAANWNPDISGWYADLYVYGGSSKYPSDHWPLGATVTFTEGD